MGILRRRWETVEEPVSSGVFGLPFRTLLSREVLRFMKVWTQTLLTSVLYMLRRGYKLRY
jgi:hypothetical protein